MSDKSVPQEFSVGSVPQELHSYTQECPTRVPYKSVSQVCNSCGRVADKSVPEECPTRLSHKSARQECPARVSDKSVLQAYLRRTSCKSVLQECAPKVSHKSPTTRVSYMTVPRQCLTNVPHKSVPQKCPTRLSYVTSSTDVAREVAQESPTRVSCKDPHKNVSQGFRHVSTRVSHENLLQESPTRAFYKGVADKNVPQKSVPQNCFTRVSHKSVLQESQERLLQECQKKCLAVCL